jgi:hypothetical protein
MDLEVLGKALVWVQWHHGSPDVERALFAVDAKRPAADPCCRGSAPDHVSV